MIDGDTKGFIVRRPEPGRRLGELGAAAQGAAQPRLARRARPRRDRDRVVLARLARRSRPARSRAEDIGTEVFFLPAAAHTEKDGTFTNTQRLLQWHHKAVEPPGRLPLGAVVRLPPGPPHPRAARGLDDPSATARCSTSTWDYPLHGPQDEPDAEAVLQEINGRKADGIVRRPSTRSSPTTARRPAARGSTPASTPTASTRRRAASRAPSRTGSRPSGAGRGRRTAASSTTARRPTPTASRGRSASATSGGTPSRASGRRSATTPTSSPTSRRTTCRAEGATGMDALARRRRRSSLHPDGLGWLYAPTGLVDGPLPTHYEPHESPVDNPLYAHARQPDAPASSTAPTTRTTRAARRTRSSRSC